MGFEITRKLAYETGVHIGDGNLYSKNRTHKITYAGDLRNEETYYVDLLKPIIEEVYGIEPVIIRNVKRNAILLVLNSKRIAEFKASVLGLPNGKKTHIRIPEIIKQHPKLLLDCIRGIGDTDFSVTFKKTRQQTYSEPRIELFSRSTELVDELHQCLVGLRFTATKETRLRRGFLENRLILYGKRNLLLWMKKIGFLNPYRLLKVKVWAHFGEVKPGQSLHDYLHTLDSL